MRIACSLLGATGSIGCSALDVLEGLQEDGAEVRVAALTAHRSVERLAEQARRWRPSFVGVADEAAAAAFQELMGEAAEGIEVGAGLEGLVRAAEHPDAEVVLNALVGRVGLIPTVRALEAGRRIALANKETLVVGGGIVTRLAAVPAGEAPRLLPVDSEHSALMQALGDHPDEEVERLILTASGGPFRETPVERFKEITAAQALDHPTWNMGPKITVDSATLMNKGLEVIEAHWLFGIPVTRIGVVVHPQSIVHSFVEFVDGNILAHLSVPDMRLPIQYALTYPKRVGLNAGGRLAIEDLGSLHFERPDEDRFPALGLCKDAVAEGGTAPAVLNGANEVAVAAFLAGDLDFPGITGTIRRVLEKHRTVQEPDLDDLIVASEWAERETHALIGTRHVEN